jgi:hypothetical protein
VGAGANGAGTAGAEPHERNGRGSGSGQTDRGSPSLSSKLSSNVVAPNAPHSLLSCAPN